MTTKTIKQQPEYEGFLERLGKRLDNASKWHKRLLAVGAIIATVSGTVVAISNNLNSALDTHITAQTEVLADKLDQQDKELEKIRLDTLRVQLLQYIYNEPEDHDTILKLGYTYFVEYKGDWVMTNKFKQWAEDQDVKIPFDLTH